MEIAQLCKEFSSQGVVGMDIAGKRKDDGSEYVAHKEAFEVILLPF